ncbi:hypothetical protein PMAYCL1PPCAC_19517, partial [Pristionchus mayeri]
FFFHSTQSHESSYIDQNTWEFQDISYRFHRALTNSSVNKNCRSPSILSSISQSSPLDLFHREPPIAIVLRLFTISRRSLLALLLLP